MGRQVPELVVGSQTGLLTGSTYLAAFLTGVGKAGVGDGDQ